MVTLNEMTKEQIEAVLAVRGKNRADINIQIAKILNVETVNIYHNVGNNFYTRVEGLLPTISKDKENGDYFLKDFVICNECVNGVYKNWKIVKKNKKGELVIKSQF